jgi:hypothetical protein
VQDELLQRARQALALEDGSAEADEIYLGLVRSLSEQYSNNQKEIANALKDMASQIESGQGAPLAFQFKQRTCEMLLRQSIEQRHASRAAQGADGKVDAARGSNGPASGDRSKNAGSSATSSVARNSHPAQPAAPVDISDLPADLVEKAKAAALTTNPEDSELQFTELIGALEKLHDKNERQIAATLQRLSRSLTDETSAFHFKQRTCEVMLKLSMARRRSERGL